MTDASDLATRLALRRVPGRREWRGACPACGYKTGLAVTEKAGRTVWWCASCQDGRAVASAIKSALGGAWTPPQQDQQRSAQAPSEARRRALALDLWDSARPHRGTPVDRYLAARGLAGVQSMELRFHHAVHHPGGDKLPAMVAAVRHPMTRELLAVHRTYLRADGSGKALVEPAKASLGPVAGGAVLLEQPRGSQALVIGEGIETSLSAARLIGGFAWCAVSAGNLARLDLPPLPACAEVVVAADPDAPGQRDAVTAARRWHAEGRRVRIATPDTPADFNDMIRARPAHGGAVQHTLGWRADPPQPGVDRGCLPPRPAVFGACDVAAGGGRQAVRR